jgi:hypothetical protein
MIQRTRQGATRLSTDVAKAAMESRDFQTTTIFNDLRGPGAAHLLGLLSTRGGSVAAFDRLAEAIEASGKAEQILKAMVKDPKVVVEDLLAAPEK